MAEGFCTRVGFKAMRDACCEDERTTIMERSLRGRRNEARVTRATKDNFSETILDHAPITRR
ncbi:MAG: hypothetical protein KGQ48_14205 [Bradyrhizobium sp.]|nr:hypothetical protein [Bradyrhizobium sp.]